MTQAWQQGAQKQQGCDGIDGEASLHGDGIDVLQRLLGRHAIVVQHAGSMEHEVEARRELGDGLAKRIDLGRVGEVDRHAAKARTVYFD